MMTTLKHSINYVKCLVNDEKGQGMVEYGLILALIAIVVIGAVTGIGTTLVTKFTEIKDGLANTSTTL